MTDQDESLYRNRSEAPTSVVLAILFNRPNLGRPLLRNLAVEHSWKMWPRSKDESHAEELTIPDIKMEASALVFPFRDTTINGKLQPRPEWRGEIDLVVYQPSHVVIGIELKVLSSASALGTQMNDQVAGLKHLANIFHCPFLAQVALSPSHPGLKPHINCLTFSQLSDALNKLATSEGEGSDLMSAVEEQINLVKDLLEPQSPIQWDHVPLEQLLHIDPQQSDAHQWVGVMEGLENLKLTTRVRWKVARQKLGKNWYPLAEVTNRIRLQMGTAA